MSAYFVHKTTIDFLVSAAIEYCTYASLTCCDEPTCVTEQNADEFGRMLWAMNYESLRARYSFAPGSKEAREYLAAVKDYKLTRYENIKPAAVIGCGHCYEYQACETEDFYSSPAHVFVLMLVHRAAYQLAKDAPWGIDDDKTAEKFARLST